MKNNNSQLPKDLTRAIQDNEIAYLIGTIESIIGMVEGVERFIAEEKPLPETCEEVPEDMTNSNE